jgi:hypothetical protein
MKQLILSITIYLAFVTATHGQATYATEPVHELQISFSPLARPLFYSDITSLASKSFNQDFHFSNSYQLTYRYQTPKKWSLGISANLLDGWLSQNADVDLKHTSVVIGFEPKLSYLKKPYLDLYFFVGAGVVFNKNKTIVNGENIASKLYLNPTTQITPLGIRVGKKVGAFAELGYGYKGIVNLGLSGRF